MISNRKARLIVFEALIRRNLLSTLCGVRKVPYSHEAIPLVCDSITAAALSIGRQIHVEGDRIVSESPDLSITLLDGTGKPVADFDYAARTFSMPGTFELARKAIADLNQRTEEILRKVIAERYGDVDLEVFAKDSLRKVWPDREEYFYKDDLLLTVHKPRWDEITFEIHRGSKNGN